MIYRGPRAIVPSVSTPEYLLENASAYPDRPALIDGSTGNVVTYGELTRKVYTVAGSLAARGLKKGEVFAILCPNIPEYAMALLGVFAAGGIATTLNPLYTVDEIAHQLDDAGAGYLLTTPAFVEKALHAANAHPLREIFVVGEAAGATPFEELLKGRGGAPDVSIEAGDDAAVLPYSSGTTGSPKGVILTHRNLNAGVVAAQVAFPSEGGRTVAAVLPLFHIAGMVCILMMGLRQGNTLVLLPRFDFEEFLGIIQRYRIDTATTVPPILTAMLKSPLVEKYDLSSLKYITCGAAPLGGNVQVAAGKRFQVPVVQGYGMTEAAGLTHGEVSVDGSNKPGSVGPCAANIECKIVDLAGDELGPNLQGELWLRGPQVMKGYLNKPDITHSCLDSEGWYHTGDVAYADDDGCFFIVDRLKELIKYNAYQVAPAELEAVLLTHPAVAEAAVIPSPDEDAGEVPKAFVVLKAAAGVDDLLEFVAARVAPYKKIRRMEIVDQIPKSATGKILRYLLVRQERAKRGAGAA